jgi:hypothetical protein
MLDLPEKFPPFLAVYVFYDNNEVVYIKTINLALKFDFRTGPVSIRATNDAWTCASK